MSFRHFVLCLTLSASLSGNVFATQIPASPAKQFELATQLAKSTESESLSKVRDLLEQSANQGFIPAQKQLAKDLIQGLNGSVSYSQAIYWLTSIAVDDPADHGYLLANFLQSHQHGISTDDVIEAWYQLAAKKNKEAEVAYHHFLEQRFNQLRAKQISEIDELDKRAEKEVIPQNYLDKENTLLTVPFLAIGISGLLLGAGLLSYRMHKQNREHLSVQDANQTQRLSSKIKELESINNQLKRQLEKVFKEYKKTKTESDHRTLELACAMFGYTLQSIPEAQAIKLRYRQLCRIYHPDSRGNEEEMKRLNQALKTITQNVTKQ
ncbi:J domain-containing protein [Vibrio sp. YIC-376]|uniref:J domain-containing protein n=1 Tax=Vibrio sp. YIC-376 TaxID=3136162 RepID=UPI00402AB9E3